MRKLFLILGVALVTMVMTSCNKEVTDISLDKSTLTLEVGEWQLLTATVLPTGATDKSVIWTSSNPTVATVVDGIVTAIKVGKTTVIAKAGNFTATCEVTVGPPSLVGTIWKGTATVGTQCTLKFTDATNCTLSRIDYQDYSGPYYLNNYPSISIQLTGWGSFSGSIVNNQMTLVGGSSGTYSMTLTKQ